MIIIRDTREPDPDGGAWRFPGISVRVESLYQGDYSILGLASEMALERKTLSDLVSSLTTGRDRLRREMIRLRGLNYAAVIIEAGMADVRHHRYRSKADPASVIGSVASWQIEFGVPFVWAGSREGAEAFALASFRNYRRLLENRLKAVQSEP